MFGQPLTITLHKTYIPSYILVIGLTLSHRSQSKFMDFSKIPSLSVGLSVCPLVVQDEATFLDVISCWSYRPFGILKDISIAFFHWLPGKKFVCTRYVAALIPYIVRSLLFCWNSHVSSQKIIFLLSLAFKFLCTSLPVLLFLMFRQITSKIYYLLFNWRLVLGLSIVVNDVADLW